MLRNCDEDSGQSSCSVGSGGINTNNNEIDKFYTHVKKRYNMKTQEASTNTNLTVSARPRSCVILSSPDEHDPFPSCKVPKNQRKSVINLFPSPRKGGLSNAHSTLDIVSSTRIDNNGKVPSNAVSRTALGKIKTEENKYITKQENINNFRKSKPVERAASRLYRPEGMKGDKGCVGPEFIVRASQSVKKINILQSPTVENKIVTVILLNGQRIEITCDLNTTTAGQIFEAVVRSEQYEHSFMFGVACLNGGDFIFLPEEYKIKKMVPVNWTPKQSVTKGKIVSEDIPLIIFLRIIFFLPKNISRNIQSGEWRNSVYLQLRRATVEGQLASTMQNLILLAGYALHIEFGEFSYREHGSGDYFLLEHYLPEILISNDMSDVKLRMKKAHESRRGLEKNKAIVNYITLAQTFRDYGAHFYSSVWATRDGFCRDVWLAMGPSGITIYSRNSHKDQVISHSSELNQNRIVLQSLPWHHIHTFYYNKKSLYIIPNSHSGLLKTSVKYKLKMTDNKSYFVFWLASLHHRLYLRLHAKNDFINPICIAEMGSLIDIDNSLQRGVDECSNYQDSYNLAVRNPIRPRRQLKKRFHVGLFTNKFTQKKENHKPNTEELLREILLPQCNEESVTDTSNLSNNHENCSSNERLSSSESCSSPRRHGVKMGTRVFNGMKSALHDTYPRSSHYTSSNHLQNSDVELNTTQSDSDDLCSSSEHKLKYCNINGMALLPERQYNQNVGDSLTAYVIESPKVYKDIFGFNLTNSESCYNGSLLQRLDKMGCVQGDRIFITAVLHRDDTSALGLQVAEGSDGNVYIKSIIPGGPAATSKKLSPGDQIISVNGQTLLNIKYDRSLEILQAAPQTVELIVLQNSNSNYKVTDDNMKDIQRHVTNKVNVLANGVEDIEITDDELLNEEALRTIYALIKLTKDKVISRMKEKNHLNTPNKLLMQKCLSENKIYDEPDAEIYLIHDNSLQKMEQKFDTRKGDTQTKPKKRPLSLSIPADTNLSQDYFNEKLNKDFIVKNSSMKSIQTSLNGLDKTDLSNGQRNVALPRNFGLSRRWLGPVRYPVTPCKNSIITTQKKCAISSEVVRRHFVYGAGDSDEDQIFL